MAFALVLLFESIRVALLHRFQKEHLEFHSHVPFPTLGRVKW